MAQQIIFTEKQGKRSKYYEYEFIAENDFNIHLERESSGELSIDVTTRQGGMYQRKFSEVVTEVFDKDFRCRIYPKYICLSSESKPKEGLCEISFRSGSASSEDIDTEDWFEVL